MENIKINYNISATIIALFLLITQFELYSQINNKLTGYSRQILEPAFLMSKLKTNSPTLLNDKISYPYILENNKVYVQSFIEIENNTSPNFMKDLDCKILSKTGNIYSVLFPADKLEQILNYNQVISLEPSRKYSPFLDSSITEINADKTHSGFDLPHPFNGENVIVGVFDTGIDFTHPDFSDGTTRIQYLWDMSDTSKGKNPTSYNWGREYTKAEIDNSPGSILQRDGDNGNGHGTHVTGTAAGGGKGNSKFIGVAPKSDIIFVKGLRSDTKSTFSDNDIVAGCQYIFQKAEQLGKPAVINLSLGTPIGPHDGTELSTRALSSLVGPGKIIVAAAGNEGNLSIHAGDSLIPGTESEALIFPINVCEIFEDFCPDIPNLFMTAADIWYTKNSVDSVFVSVYSIGMGLEFQGSIGTAAGNSVTNLVMNDSIKFGYVSIDAQTLESGLNGDGNIFLTISNGGDTSIYVNEWIWSISLKAKQLGKVDLWAGVPTPQGYPLKGIRGRQMYGTTDMTIGSPAAGKKIISTGAYTTKNSWVDIDDGPHTSSGKIGSLASFSSKGPTRDGRIAPVISAPGDIVFSSMSSHLTEDIGYRRYNVLKGGMYMGMSGTSMASPHATGVVALILQANPKIDFEGVYNILTASARNDANTGTTPNNLYGYGKIDAYAAVKSALTLDVENGSALQTNKDFLVYPNPANNYILFDTKDFLPGTEINLFNQLGIKILSFNANSEQTRIDLSNLPSGVYYLKSVLNSQPITKMLIINK